MASHARKNISAVTGKTRPKERPVLDNSPRDLAAAARQDLRDSKCHEAVGSILGVSPGAIYKLAERIDQRVTTEHIDAILEVCGAPHVRAYIDGVIERSQNDASDHDLLETLGAMAQDATAVLQMGIEDLSPRDNTPDVFDVEELKRLDGQLAKLARNLQQVRAIVARRLGIETARPAKRGRR